MKPIFKLFIYSLIIITHFLACTTFTQGTRAVLVEEEEAPPPTIAAGIDTAGTTAVRPGTAAIPALPPDGLGTQTFRQFPSEAADYLRLLSEAFRNRDSAFLLSQGEIQYETELRPRYEDEVYLAMMFRIGSYGEDSQWGSTQVLRLHPAQLRGIEYTGWEEAGPMLRISGRIHMIDGSNIPCEIVLVWRLPEPKILGYWP